MKKVFSMFLALAIALVSMGALAESVPATPVDGMTPVAEMFAPAPPNKKPEASVEYPYLGMALNIPEALRNAILGDDVFMAVDGELDFEFEEVESDETGMENAGVSLSTTIYRLSGYVEFLAVPDAQRDRFPYSDSENAIDEYNDYLAWKDELNGLCKIGMYRKDIAEAAESIEALTGYADNEKLGEYGDYVFYFSKGADIPPELADDMQALRDGLTVSEPKEIDDKFMGFDTEPEILYDNLGAFNTTDLNGNPVTSDVFANAKLTMVNIWTTWCSPCIAEIPDLAEIAKEMAADGVQLLGIVQDTWDANRGAIDEEKKELAQVVCEKTGAEYPMLIPDAVLTDGVLSGVYGFPTTYFVDSEGNIVGESILGSHSKAEWEDIIRERLAMIGA